MMGTVNYTVRLDGQVKKEAEKVLKGLGLNLSAAINIYINTLARERKIPFELNLNNVNAYTEDRKKQLAYTTTLEEKKIAAGYLKGILAGQCVDLDREREERILNK